MITTYLCNRCEVPQNTFSLTFNGRKFFTLSAVLDHIFKFPEGEERVHIYLKIVKQASNILYLGSAKGQKLRDRKMQ